MTRVDEKPQTRTERPWVVLAVLWACVCVFLGAAGVAACIALAGIVSSEACTRLVAWARAKPGPGLQRAPHAQPASEAPIVDELEARRSAAATRRVTDAPTRMFHWLFALSFAGAYLTGDGERWRLVHVILGYTMAGLLVFRLLYGLVGPAPVRLSVLWRKLAGVPGWLSGVAQGQVFSLAWWRQGGAVAMGAAIAGILLVAMPLLLSGYATYDEWGGEWLEEVHELFANLVLMLVLAVVVHLLGMHGQDWWQASRLTPLLELLLAGLKPVLPAVLQAWLP